LKCAAGEVVASVPIQDAAEVPPAGSRAVAIGRREYSHLSGVTGADARGGGQR